MMSTNSYYDNNFESFINDTFNCNMNEEYNLFEKYLNNAKTIMDLGFGSGRDSLYFKSKGYDVYSLDPSIKFCENAKMLNLDHILCMPAQNINFIDKFDGIWACASLLHIPSTVLNDVFKRCSKALKNNGIMYVSFKYGDFEGIRNHRFFIDLNEESLKKYLIDTKFDIIDLKITIDVRPDKSTKWLNVILKKS